MLSMSACLMGIVLAQAMALDTPAPIFALAVVLAGLGLVVPGTGGRTLVLLAIACLGAGRLAMQDAPPVHHMLHRMASLPVDDAGNQRAMAEVLAIVSHEPIDPNLGKAPWEMGVFQARQSVLLARAVSMDLGQGHAPTQGQLRVRVSEDLARAPTLTPGTPILVSGWISPPGIPINPGPSRVPRAPICTLETDGWSLVSPAELPSDSWRALLAPIQRARYRLQQGARRVLALDRQHHEPDPARALLAALVLGQHDPGFDEAYDPFRRVGLAHLLAISGLHLAILAGAAAWALRFVGPNWRIEALGVALAVATLLVIVPGRTPIVRAGVMVLALLAARALGRRHDALAVLAWTALAIALVEPYQVFDLGYQLSFGLVATLLAMAPRAHEAIFGSPHTIKGLLEQPPPLWKLGAGSVGGAVGRLFSATALCWLVSMPWIAFRTGLLAPVTVPATLVATPLVGGLLIFAYASLLVGTIVPPLAEPLSHALDAIARLNLGVVRWFDALPYASVPVPEISPALAICATAVVVAIARAGRRARWNHFLALLVIAVWAVLEALRPWSAPPPEVRLHTLAVSDGTAHLLVSKDQAFLWDCGSLGHSAGNITVRAAKALLDVPVRAAILTHADLDHANGLPRAMRELGISTLYTTPQALQDAQRGLMGAIFEDLRTQGVTIHTLSAGDTLTLGDATGLVLWPPPHERFLNNNDASLVVRWESPSGHSLLLTGDIGGAALSRLINITDPDLLRVDVLELPHHGARDDHARRLVSMANARVVVQSAGTRRVRNDPWHDYRPHGLWLVTGRDGAIDIRFEIEGIIASTIRRGTLMAPERAAEHPFPGVGGG